MSKLRVYHIPQVTMEAFYIPVKTVGEAKKIMDVLSAYEAFQLQNRIKPDYTNTNGLETFDEENNEWVSWDIEIDDDYYDDVDEYCESEHCKDSESIMNDNKEIFTQIDWGLIEWLTQ